MAAKKSNSARGSKQTSALKGASQKPKVQAKASKPQAKKQTRAKQPPLEAAKQALKGKQVKPAKAKTSKAVSPLAQAAKIAKAVKLSKPATAVKSATPKRAAVKSAAAKKPVAQKPQAAPVAKTSSSAVKGAPRALKAPVTKRAKQVTAAGATPDAAGKHLTSAGSAPAQLSLEGVLPEVSAGSTVDVGDRLPEFVLVDQNGARVTSESLLGAPVVLYFYPKDDTPGCTAEACGFRDEVEGFSASAVRVVGVSPDKPASHGRFAQKYDLNFTLLADVDRLLCTAFGVWKLKKNYGREYLGVERSTFLLDAGGRIVRAWRGVRVAGHVAEVLEAAKNLSRNPKRV